MEGIEGEGAPSEEKPTQGETAPITEDKPLAAAALASHPDDNATKTISNLTIMYGPRPTKLLSVAYLRAYVTCIRDQCWVSPLT
jgi:hypothetical protein